MKRIVYFFLPLALALLGLSACKEDDNTVEEFPNWQARNETYFTQAYQQALTASATNPNVKVLHAWSLPASRNQPTDFVVVKVLETGTGTIAPLYTDTAMVHLQGRLIPSTTYTKGKVFVQTWQTETFSPTSNAPQKVSNSQWGVGLGTALLHMHKGDRWQITVPAALTTGIDSRYGIPANSTLVFDVMLAGSYHAGKTSAQLQAKKLIGATE